MYDSSLTCTTLVYNAFGRVYMRFSIDTEEYNRSVVTKVNFSCFDNQISSVSPWPLKWVFSGQVNSITTFSFQLVILEAIINTKRDCIKQWVTLYLNYIVHFVGWRDLWKYNINANSSLNCSSVIIMNQKLGFPAEWKSPLSYFSILFSEPGRHASTLCIYRQGASSATIRKFTRSEPPAISYDSVSRVYLPNDS